MSCRFAGNVRFWVWRSRAFTAPRPANDNHLMLMRRIDELFTAWPFLGSRRLTVLLRAEGYLVNLKARAASDAANRDFGARPPAEDDKPGAGAQDLPPPCCDLVIDRRNQVWAADITYIPIWARHFVSGGDHRLGEPGDIELAVVEHDGCVVLCFSARGGAGPLRQTRDLQYRPRQSVHQRCLHRHTGRRRNSHLHGWQRPLDRQPRRV